ncbi:MAG: RNA polymerase sigma factor [Planctomycetota bacterium]
MSSNRVLATDDELMEGFVRGDGEAAELLMRRHGGALLGFLVRLLGNYHDAQEVFQDAFVRLLEKKDSYRPEGTFRGYLFKVAHNLALDRLRHRSVRKEISVEGADAEENSYRDIVQIDTQTPLELLERRELSRVLEQAVDELPATLREAFLLKRYGELDYEQVAKMLDVSVSAAKMRVSRALDFIENAVGAYIHENSQRHQLRRRKSVD